MAIGDSGTGSPEQRQIAALMAADTYDVLLHAGDIAYGNTGGTGDASYKTFNDWFFDMYASLLPFHALYTTEGNHDSRPSNGNGVAYLDAFTLPGNGGSPAYPDHAERYYSFDYGRVHFVVLDTEFAFQDTARRAEQLSWLESDLAGTAQPWKIALFHRSPYSAGGEHGSDLAVRSAFTPLFEQYGVQLVLSGHEHDYERTLPTRAAATGTAVTYIVTGGGGAPLYPAGTASWTAYSASRHHYVRATVTECTLSAQAIGLNGSTFDSVTLERCAPPPAAGEIVLYASEAAAAGRWVVETDSTAAGGARIRHPDIGAAKLTTALAQPANYFELTFNATAGVPYRLWMRGKADRNYWGNDSVFAQFDNSVTCQRSGAVQDRHDRRRGDQYRRLQRLRSFRLGLAGQRLGRRRDGPADPVLPERHPADPRSDPRGRPRDRPDRAVARALSQRGARRPQERQHHPHSALSARRPVKPFTPRVAPSPDRCDSLGVRARNQPPS